MSRRKLIEKVAKMMAIGNNGGDWAMHYNDAQKDVWRDRAEYVIGYANGRIWSRISDLESALRDIKHRTTAQGEILSCPAAAEVHFVARNALEE